MQFDKLKIVHIISLQFCFVYVFGFGRLHIYMYRCRHYINYCINTFIKSIIQICKVSHATIQQTKLNNDLNNYRLAASLDVLTRFSISQLSNTVHLHLKCFNRLRLMHGEMWSVLYDKEGSLDARVNEAQYEFCPYIIPRLFHIYRPIKPIA